MPPSLQTLRSLRWLARCVLAWWVLSIGAAVASPWVRPQSLELICSGSGAIQLVVKADDGAQEWQRHTLDCPLCTHGSAPPPMPRAHVPVVQPLAHALRPLAAAPVTARTAAPPPPRGPPALS